MKTSERDKGEVNKDFNEFKLKVSSFVHPYSKVVSYTNNDFKLSEEFKYIFPKLTNLLEFSRITSLNIDSQYYILFAWDNQEGEICGWLNKVESTECYFCELIEEHELLLRNIGGIKESFNQPENSFTNNQNFVFIGSECTRGIGDYEDYYSMLCEEEGLSESDFLNLLAFSQEENGALTLYEPITKEIFLFSHDHSFENVEFVKNQPKYTFHTVKNAVNFVDYVEELADQWLRYINRQP